MADEVTKPLLKGDNITLVLKVNDGRIRLSANQLEDSSLQLRAREKLEIVVRSGSLVVTRKTDFDAMIAEAKSSEEDGDT